MNIAEYTEYVKNLRKELIPTPEEILNEIYPLSKFPQWTQERFRKNASIFVEEVRDLCWTKYLDYEDEFTKAAYEPLMEEHSSEPISQRDTIINFVTLHSDSLFWLHKSTSNSRRSRAGRTFELIVYKLLDQAGIEYDTQKKIGKQVWSDSSLGKIVDCVIPSAEQYNQDKRNCTLLSMKTSLRERWQEVVEEMKRTAASHVMLATLDTEITNATIGHLNDHNITLVVPKANKDNLYSEFNSVLDFETLIAEEAAKLP